VTTVVLRPGVSIYPFSTDSVSGKNVHFVMKQTDPSSHVARTVFSGDLNALEP